MKVSLILMREMMFFLFRPLARRWKYLVLASPSARYLIRARYLAVVRSREDSPWLLCFRLRALRAVKQLVQ